MSYFNKTKAELINLIEELQTKYELVKTEGSNKTISFNPLKKEDFLADSMLEFIIENNSDLTWTVDSVNFGLLSYNKPFEDFFLKNKGIQVKTGDRPENLLSSADLADIWSKMYKTALLQGSYIIEYTTQIKPNFIELNFYTIHHDKETIGISVFCKNITERKIAENELILAKEKAQESDRRYRMLFEASGHSNSIFDQNCCLILQNSISKMELGINGDEAIGLSVIELFGQETGSKIAERMQRVFKTGIPEIHETLFNLKKSKKWYRSSYQPVWDENRQTNALQIISLDITEQKLSEEALQKSNAFIQNLIENLPQRIFLKDLNSEYILCNELYANDLEIKKEEIAGKNDFHFYPTELAVSYRNADQEVILTGNNKTYEEKYYSKNKNYWVKVSKAPFRNNLGEIIGVLGVFEDITIQKHAEEEVLLHKEILEQSVEERTKALKLEIELRKQTESALIESENRYRSLVDYSTSIVLEWDTEGNVVFLNKYGLEFFGFKPDEIIGHNVLGTIVEPIDTGGNDLAAKMRVVQKHPEEYYSSENENIRKNGEKVWITWTNKGIFNSNNKLVKTLSVGIDRSKQHEMEKTLLEYHSHLKELVDERTAELTRTNEILVQKIAEHKIAETKLFESRTLIKSIIDSTSDMIWSVDSKHFGLLNWNISLHDYFLIERGIEIEVGMSPFDLFPANSEYITFWCEMYQHTLNSGSFTKEYTTITGTRILFINFGLLTQGDETYGISVFAKDITKQKLAELETKESQVLLNTLINSTSDMIWLVDAESYDLLNWNSAFEKHIKTRLGIGITAGSKLEHMFPSDSSDLKEWIGFFEKAKTTGNFSTDYKFFGDEIDELITFNLIYRDNKPFGISVFGKDITERKKAEKDLIIAKEKAEESDRLKSAFLANMSHEIRTPMNGILGFSTLLSEPGLTGEDKQEFISMIQHSGKRMLNIIQEIIDISKIESGIIQLNIDKANINDLIKHIFKLLKPEADKKGITLSVKNELEDAESEIITDREKLYAIFTNLVKNAIKYTDVGTVEFGYFLRKANSKKIASAKTEFEFFVKDTGIGIQSHRQEAIFERFIQADIKDIQARQGAGLGLSIAKAYVELLGGKIGVRSKPGKGSTFFFTLKTEFIPTRVTSTKTANSKMKVDNRIQNLNILVVDDDETSKVLIEKIVETITDNKITFAQSGIEAVKSCKANSEINLVLMDIRMPDMNGYEATRQIRKFNKEVIIIAQTAFVLLGDKEKAIDSGCNDYISKPILKDNLLAIISKYFKK